MKVCRICNLEKDQSGFYYGIGKVCKECVKARNRGRELKLRQNPDFVENERKRHREKYVRLGYKQKQKEWDKDRPWKNTAAYKNLKRDLKLPKGFEAHHWNYNDVFMKDIIVLSKKQHKEAHKELIFNTETLIFMSIDNVPLDSKQKHLEHLIIKGIFLI